MGAVVPPGAPAALRAILASLRDAVAGLQVPAEPKRVFAAASGALPPAGAYPNTVVLVSDLNILAHSDGLHWIRQDTGAPIA
jgi:hypothetical protein